MTTEEKLKHFQDICMEDARAQSNQMLDKYMETLEKDFEEHKESAKLRAKARIHAESEKIQREINKTLSLEQINLKREISQKHDELKGIIFNEVKDMLEHFMSTQDYEDLLESQVEAAKKFAGSNEMTIYMDPVDENLVRAISHRHNVNIKLSEYSFMGGTRAVIPAKHVLIDNSFQTKLEEAAHDFKMELGGSRHE